MLQALATSAGMGSKESASQIQKMLTKQQHSEQIETVQTKAPIPILEDHTQWQITS